MLRIFNSLLLGGVVGVVGGWVVCVVMFVGGDVVVRILFIFGSSNLGGIVVGWSILK